MFNFQSNDKNILGFILNQFKSKIKSIEVKSPKHIEFLISKNYIDAKKLVVPNNININS
jgi:hypothetical protein